MANEFDLRSSQLKGYLREFFCKPDMKQSLWDTARACLDNPKVSFYGIKFPDDVSMRQFALAVLLSSGKQFNWFYTKSYKALQDSLAGEMLITDYSDYDIVFIIHEDGTMWNKIMGQTLNQIAVLRAPKKTFLFDRGGYALTDLIVPRVSVADLTTCASKSVNYGNGDNL
jgi:hypothetical protein